MPTASLELSPPRMHASGAHPVVHALAVITFIAALPLLFLGAEVTTKGVGMVDQTAVRSPWYFLAEFMKHQNLGWLIEHGHRQVGWIVGLCTIGLAVATFLLEARAWLRILSAMTLVAVSVQGVLGIFRIHLNEILGKTLALVHGGFAQIVFALLMTMMIVTGRHWAIGRIEAARMTLLRRWAVTTTLAVYVQLLLGGLIRHKESLLGARLHLLGAFVVFAFVFVTIKVAREADYASFKGAARVLMALLTLQVMLGAEAWFAWMLRFFRPELAAAESVAVQIVRSGHYVIGALIFSTLVVMTVKSLWAPRVEVAA